MATIKQKQFKVDITTFGGFTASADDAVLYGQGQAAYTSLEERRDIWIENEGVLTFIPFHAVDHAIVTPSMVDVEKPEDANCPEEP